MQIFSHNKRTAVHKEVVLTHEEERKQMALAGMERCKKSGYSNEEMIKRILQQIATGNIQNEE
jgi:spore maturation protein CgeB